ncbi:hypothetical protein ACMYSQ_009320 [Aspergillus niger]|nr:hypothetical protein AnigIFM63326_011247 [Aspergillus niger]
MEPIDFNTLSISDIYNRFGEPFQVPISRTDNNPIQPPHAPTHAIIPMNPIIPDSQLTNCTIRITDFGSSSFFGQE